MIRIKASDLMLALLLGTHAGTAGGCGHGGGCTPDRKGGRIVAGANRMGRQAVMAGKAATPEMQKYTTFAEFYRFYLREHADRSSRRLHFLGLVLALACLALLFATGNWLWLPLVFVAGYGFAWAGHLLFEKNRPASFRQPLYSFMGDWRMFFDMLTGRIPF